MNTVHYSQHTNVKVVFKKNCQIIVQIGAQYAYFLNMNLEFVK